MPLMNSSITARASATRSAPPSSSISSTEFSTSWATCRLLKPSRICGSALGCFVSFTIDDVSAVRDQLLQHGVYIHIRFVQVVQFHQLFLRIATFHFFQPFGTQFFALFAPVADQFAGL